MGEQEVVVTAETVIRKIRERICSNIVLNTIIDDLKSDRILSSKKLKALLTTELSNDFQRQYSKFKVTQCKKINFQEFKSFMNFPDWLIKKPAPIELEESISLISSASRIMDSKLNPVEQAVRKHEIQSGHLFSAIGLEDFLFESRNLEYNSFYRLILEYKEKNKVNDKNRISVLIKINPDYPNK
jgi:hypothetical protein